MSRFPRARNLAMFPVLFALLPLACSRPVDTAQADQRRAPFGDSENAPAGSPAGQPSAAEIEKSDSGLPFRGARTLPAGTLLTVRLKNAISTDNLGSSGNFDAVLDDAVLIAGSALLPRGASVAGRVESSQTSSLRNNRGYIRLTLDSVNVAGRDLPIQTSSLFVRGNLGDARSADGASSLQIVRLDSGRRLTFRLTEPAFISNPPDKPVP